MRKHVKKMSFIGLFTLLICSATMVAYAMGESVTATADLAVGSTTATVNPIMAIVAAVIAAVVSVVIYGVRHQKKQA